MDTDLDSVDVQLELATINAQENRRSALVLRDVSQHGLTRNRPVQIPNTIPNNVTPLDMDRNLRQSKPRLLLMGQRRYNAWLTMDSI
jgi:hypothetical protein